MSTGRSPIFCSAVLALFSFPNSPLSSQLHPFRTLKVQWGRMSSAAGGLAQEVLRTHCRLLDFNPKNSTGRSPIFGLAFFTPFPFPNAPFRSQLHPFRTLKVQQGCFAHTAAYAISTLKTAQDARTFLFWPFVGLPPTAWLTIYP